MEQVEAFCKKWDMLPRGALVLCAVSGGRDSMCLLHLLSALAAEGGFQVAAAHFNHCLRPTADRDEAFVRSWCGARGIPLSCAAGEVAAFARETGTGLEDAARTLRYRFLEETAARLGAARIATAHHREDNAETVLLHLLRGAGMQGLTGIAPVRGQIIRPLLETSRADIDRYIAAHQIPYMEDETNADAGFARNRLRLEVLPLLEEIFPGCAGRIAGTGELLREENNYLRREAERLVPEVKEGEIALSAALLDRQGPALRRRLVRSAGQRLGAELSRVQTEALLALGSGRYLNLSGGLYGVRHAGGLVLGRGTAPLPPLALREGEQVWGPWRVRLATGRTPPEEAPHTIYLRADAGPLTIAAWDGQGRLTTERGSRTIKRLFADRGIPVQRRQDHPALYREGRPVAVFGVAADWACLPRAGEPCLAVTLESNRPQRP